MFIIFIAVEIKLILADYYLAAGEGADLKYFALLSLPDTPSTFCLWNAAIANKVSCLPKNLFTPEAGLEQKDNQWALTGFSYFAPEADAQANLCFAKVPDSVDGALSGLLLAADCKLFQGVMPAELTVGYPSFRSQTSFYIRSLPMLNTITEEELAISPFSVYSFALQLVMEGAPLQKTLGNNLFSIGATCASLNNQIFFPNGSVVSAMALKTSNFPSGSDTSSYRAPHAYYEIVNFGEKAKFWQWGTPLSDAVCPVYDLPFNVIKQLYSGLSFNETDPFPLITSLMEAIKAPIAVFLGSSASASLVLKSQAKKKPGVFKRMLNDTGDFFETISDGIADGAKATVNLF